MLNLVLNYQAFCLRNEHLQISKKYNNSKISKIFEICSMPRKRQYKYLIKILSTIIYVLNTKNE